MTLADNIRSIRGRIDAAARRAGRSSDEIRLIAVSKMKSAAMIREAFAAGQHLFGENYAQELALKAEELKDLPIEWHFIGHLQKNKAKLVAKVAACMETIDSITLAEAISRKAPNPIDCLIEVNIGSEEKKSGIASSGLEALASRVAGLPNINLRGLMIIPPYDPDPEKSRPYFRKLKELLGELNKELPLPLKELSMGMSEDFEIALEEGATIVRVGTAIFGERAQ